MACHAARFQRFQQDFLFTVLIHQFQAALGNEIETLVFLPLGKNGLVDINGGNENELDGYAGALSWDIGPVRLAAAYQVDSGGDVADDQKVGGLSGAWTIGKIGTWRLGYENLDDGTSENTTAITTNYNMGFGGGWGGMIGLGYSEDKDGGHSATSSEQVRLQDSEVG